MRRHCFFVIWWKSLQFSIHSVLSSCFLDSLLASSLNTPGICVAVSQLFCVLMNSHIRCTSLSISIDVTLPILLLAEMADVLSVWIRMQLWNSFLRKVFKPHLPAFSSKTWVADLLLLRIVHLFYFVLVMPPSQMMKCQYLLWQIGFILQWGHRHQ